MCSGTSDNESVFGNSTIGFICLDPDPFFLAVSHGKLLGTKLSKIVNTNQHQVIITEP